jgi:L-threonylcarbamoyladenylate synthase
VKTEVLPISADRPEPAIIARAAAVLRAGGLVAFPTETVYGLGANARDAAAVAGIFAAKGRPANNPLIVHVPGPERVREVVADWPDAAARLAARFWPGPLTLVLPKHPDVPATVTAGGPTVAVRMPAHPVALALLHAEGVPVAATSANRSTQLSPTQAAHVLRGLDGRIDMVLDAGPTAGGLESTVLDLSTMPPRLLRPGLLAPAALEAVVGPIRRTSQAVTAEGRPLPSPGMMARHYAPRVPLECVEDSGEERVEELRREGLHVGWLTFAAEGGQGQGGITVQLMPRDPAAYAARLYAALHELDAAGVDRIIVELPPDAEEWLAARDRLRRASAGR